MLSAERRNTTGKAWTDRHRNPSATTKDTGEAEQGREETRYEPSRTSDALPIIQIRFEATREKEKKVLFLKNKKEKEMRPKRNFNSEC
jgi:hypothetical protein